MWKVFVFGVLQVVFYRIRTEYGDLQSTSLYSVQMLEKKDQKTPNSEKFHGVCDEFFNLWQIFLCIWKHLQWFSQKQKKIKHKVQRSLSRDIV